MSESIEIRPFASPDEEAVVSLWRVSFPDDPPQYDLAKSIRTKMATQPELFLVATVGSRVVGTVLGGFDGYRGWIYRVAVDQAFQRQGVATALVRRVEQELIALGAPKINLQIRSSNDAVVAFYERLGYIVEPRVSMGKRVQQ
jgi:ribosomal protein S18 acetylase RimI-like enzyme